MLAVTAFETTNSVFIITNENDSFSISTRIYWISNGGSETFFKLRELIKLREGIDIELHFEEVRKKGNQIKIGDKDYKLSDLDTRKNKIIK